MNNKLLNLFLLVLAAGGMLSSCLSDKESYNAGFVFYQPYGHVSALYANNTSDTIIFYSYGNWKLTEDAGASWLSLSKKQGTGGVYDFIRLSVSENVSGESRQAIVNFVDTDHPSEANAAFYVVQYATRGDGTLGSAADVKAITGSDGSKMTFAYDALHRPTGFVLTQNDSPLRQLSIRYDDADSIMYVEDGGQTFRSYYGRSYQPQFLISDTDSMGYSTFYGVSMNSYFNFEHRCKDSKENTTVRYRFTDAKTDLSADQLHCADTLSYFKGGSLVHKLHVAYSENDNRHQSVDVNQLLLGADQLDPYLLLSLFRYARNTSIMSVATEADKTEFARVTVALNADKSVKELTVRKAAAEEVTYVFEY